MEHYNIRILEFFNHLRSGFVVAREIAKADKVSYL